MGADRDAQVPMQHSCCLVTIADSIAAAQDYLGKTPLDLARDRGFNEAALAQNGVALALLGCSALLGAFRS